MNKSIILFSIICLFVFKGIAQTAKLLIQQINYIFKKKLYMQAIPKYESVLKKDSSNADVLN